MAENALNSSPPIELPRRGYSHYACVEIKCLNRQRVRFDS